MSSNKPSKGTVRIQIQRIGDDDKNPRPPAKEQVAAYAYLKEHEVEVTQTIMEALLKYYTDLRKRWLKKQPDLDLPDIQTVAQMRKNVGLGTLHMHETAKDGVAYYGLEMGCTWDEEHAAGVVMHKGRVVEVGAADTSFAEWVGTNDGGKEIE